MHDAGGDGAPRVSLAATIVVVALACVGAAGAWFVLRDDEPLAVSARSEPMPDDPVLPSQPRATAEPVPEAPPGDPSGTPELAATTAWLREQRVTQEAKFVVEISPPYVVWQQYEEITDPERAHLTALRIEKAQGLARRNAILLHELHRRFRELFAEPLSLPDLAAGGRQLDALVLWGRDEYVRLLAGRFRLSTPAARAYTCVSGRRTLSYVSDEALRSQDELPVADGRVQKVQFGLLLHEGTHQLLHAYATGQRGPTAGLAGTDVLAHRSFWLVEGLGEFMGAVEVDAPAKETLAGAAFVHNRIHGHLAALVLEESTWDDVLTELVPRTLAKRWTVDELVAPADAASMIASSVRLEPRGAATLRQLYVARAWCLVHFLWHYDDGRHRAGLVDCVGRLLRAEDGPEAFDEIFGASGSAERAALEAEFEWYWDQVVARRFGWKDRGRGKPWNTVTDAPRGRYQPR
jgi:hypothetical protein